MTNLSQNYGIATLNPSPFQDTATVAVTGLGRSGTTMVSRTLLALGLDMGTNVTPQSAEDKDIQLALKAQDLSHFTDICRERDALRDVWGFKCPALRGVLSQATPLMRTPRVIIIFRDILAISERNSLSVGTSLADALKGAAKGYNQMVRQIDTLSAPTLLISYEKALQYPERLVQSVAEFSGIQVTDEKAAQIARDTIMNADPRYTGAKA